MGTLWIGKVRPMNTPDAEANAIFTQNGIIRSVGSIEDLKSKHDGMIDQINDVRPYVIYPGFVDSHLHVMSLGLQLLRLNLSTARSSGQMKEMIVHKAAELTPGEWLLGESWNENNFPDRKIFHRRELDAIAPYHPMALTRVCHHATLANSQALALAGIDERTPDPQGGVVVRDNDGQPTGLLLDNAQDLLRQVIPPLSKEELEKACRVAMRHLQSLGLVSGHTEDLGTYGIFEPTFSVLVKVANDMGFRAHLLVRHNAVDVMHQNGYHAGDQEGYVTLGSMKIFADGAFGGRTAWLRQPYNDVPETSGVAIHSNETLRKLVAKARRYRMAVAIHTIGDQALEAALDAIELYPLQGKIPDRIIHGQLAPPDLRARMRELPLIVDIQPSFVTSDFPWVVERLGEARMTDAYAWKTLLNDGILCAGSSDAPIEYANPLIGIHAAVNRTNSQAPGDGFYPGQKLTVYEAIRLYTVGARSAVSEEKQAGTIVPGKAADFTVLSEDLFTIPEQDINEVKNIMTVVDEQVVYQKQGTPN